MQSVSRDYEMARLKRICPPNISQHIIQRGNNRQICFACVQDFEAYIAWLKQYSEEYNVQVHAWVLMTNHVHLLCTPTSQEGISKLMQSLGRQYVRYFNNTYKRTGTLWEGRFKSCLVDSDNYLLTLYRYIELNPVRAHMVNYPAEYKWSSYQINAIGKPSSLCTAHAVYESLGKTKIERLKVYTQLVNEPLSHSQIEQIRIQTNKGMAIGSEKFKEQITALTGRRVQPTKLGRPIKSNKATE